MERLYINNNEYIIRKAKKSDLIQVSEIYNYYIQKKTATMDTEFKTEEYYLNLLNSFTSKEGLWILTDAKEIIGWSMIKLYSPRKGYSKACETATYINHEYLNKGFGTVLKKYILKKCQSLGFYHIVAKIFSSNTQSIRYNQNLGYSIVGEQKNIGMLDNKWINITIMQYLFNENGSSNVR